MSHQQVWITKSEAGKYSTSYSNSKPQAEQQQHSSCQRVNIDTFFFWESLSGHWYIHFTFTSPVNTKNQNYNWRIQIGWSSNIHWKSNLITSKYIASSFKRYRSLIIEISWLTSSILYCWTSTEVRRTRISFASCFFG